MREKTEVIAYVRSLYTDSALPDWVGKFKDKVDYAEILRKEGIELPAMNDDASADEDVITEEELNIKDVQDGTPVQASAMVANDFEPQTPTSTHEQSSTPTHSHPQQGHEQRHEQGIAEAYAEPPT